MTKCEPKFIMNLSMESEELDAYVQAAMDKYMERLIVKELDDRIEKFVTGRITDFLEQPGWTDKGRIRGFSLREMMDSALNKRLREIIDARAIELAKQKIKEVLS